MIKLKISDPIVVLRGARYEDVNWGPYQFASPFRRPNGNIAVGVYIGEDNILDYTSGGSAYLESADGGDTWQPASPDVTSDNGLTLPNGDVVHFPRIPATPLDGYEIPPFTRLTPGTDFAKKAAPGTLPLQDGVTSHWGTVIRAYRAERLPAPLDKKEWYMTRKTPDGVVHEEHCALEWDYLTRVVFCMNGKYSMKGIYPTGRPKIGPDGAVWITAFSGEGHLDPKNGQYSPYYAAELFRSTDNCHSFTHYAHMGYPADGDRYPYLSGGFSDNDIAFFDDGSMAWFFRSAWFGSTGREAAPMYWSRSTDLGKTWSAPEEFSFTGIYPNPCRLDCGVTLLCYARPGLFLTACPNNDSTAWIEPIELMTAGDRSGLSNTKKPPDKVDFHDWDGACHNATLIAVDDRHALIFNTDFFYPDENGVKRKTVYCQKITVEDV